MADQLISFLIEVARDVQKLDRFLTDPIGEAEAYGVPTGQAEILQTQDAREILAQLQEAPGGVWVWVAIKGPKAVKPSGRTRKTVASRSAKTSTNRRARKPITRRRPK